MSACSIPLIDRARGHGPRTAIVSASGVFSYGDLLDASLRVASGLLAGQRDLEEARVAFLLPRDFVYGAVQWGVWRAGGVAVPLCEAHPTPELKYVIEDSGASMIVADAGYAPRLRPLADRMGLKFFSSQGLLDSIPASLPDVDPGQQAMIIYTSGTTGQPKGVVTSHVNIQAQITCLTEAWEWTADDRILNVLPLHHVHGVINVLACALWAGAVCEMQPRFDADEVWDRFIQGGLTLFMAVPTIYVKLIKAWEEATPGKKRRMSRACRELRLFVSGSAALPVSVFRKWERISGQAMLERYGMTEIGMALSNPLHGKRRPGFVGVPLPRVEVRQVDEAGVVIDAGRSGELQVRGPSVFDEYWQRPDETAACFGDGWFATGDVAVVEDGSYRILGRKSTDIIKTGGYKVSALEIEEALRTHPAVRECAVVGVPDPEWGERVAAAVILNQGEALGLDGLRTWCKRRLAPYKIPSRLMVVTDLPRNPMGKVTKPALGKMFEQAEEPGAS